MAKAIKYESYEAWVVGRIERAKLRTLSTASLMKLPKYLWDLELEPSDYDLEKRLRALRDQGTLSVSSQRWTMRGPFVPPSPAKPKPGPKPHPKQLSLLGGE